MILWVHRGARESVFIQQPRCSWCRCFAALLMAGMVPKVEARTRSLQFLVARRSPVRPQTALQGKAQPTGLNSCRPQGRQEWAGPQGTQVGSGQAFLGPGDSDKMTTDLEQSGWLPGGGEEVIGAKAHLPWKCQSCHPHWLQRGPSFHK